SDHRVEEIRERSLAPAHRPRVQHAADARHVAPERDPPEPAILEDEDPDIALLPPRPAPRAAEMGEERHLAESWHRPAPAEARREEGVAPARVHQEARADLPGGSVLADTDVNAVRIESHLLHRCRLQQRDSPRGRRVIEQDQGELGPGPLEAVVGPRIGLPKGERVLEPRLLIVKVRAVLGDEATLANAVEHAETLE